MKIVCDSCSAKYSIADEKVAGRVFKIRCKKCGAAIVVRGDQVDTAAETEEASTRVVDYGGDAVWHIVVDGEQQGPFAPAQLGEMLSAGTIGWDAFVWREGFDDWKPAQDIEDLVQAIMGGAQQAEAAPDAGAAEADPFAATQHAASAEPEGGMFGAPAAVAARGSDAGADLFAQTDAASPFGGGAAEEEDDVVASSPSPRVSADQALTGARNENSVLFSLSNLQALATGPGGGSSPSSAGSVPSASPKPGMAAGEGSGLIDIRALASATGVTAGGGGPVTPASSDNKVDDLLSIGGAGSIGLGSSLGAPVLIPEKKEESSKLPMFLAIGVAAVALLAVVGMGAAMFLGDDEEAPVAAAGTVAPGQTVAPAGAAAPEPTPAPPAADPAAPTPQAVGAAEAEPEEEEEASADAEEEEEGAERAGRRGRTRRDRPRASAGGGGGASAEREEPAPRRRSGSNDIDSLLNEAIGGGGGGGSRGGGGGGGGGGAASGPDTPSRSSVVSAMRGVQGAVSACGNGAHGMATVRVTFSSSGRVSGANVSGSLPGPVKSCISRAVRRARVPAFRQSSFSVNYPFRI